MDTLEERVLQLEREHDELANLLCDYIDTDLATPWRSSAERLVEALRAQQAMRAASRRVTK
jgi:hypothetical protein